MVEFFRPLSADKHVYIEIIGGDMDGRIYDSQSDDIVERKLVDQMLYYTDNGKLYRPMQGNSLTHEEANLSGTATGHKYSAEFANQYFATDYIEEGAEVLIRLTYKATRQQRHRT